MNLYAWLIMNSNSILSIMSVLLTLIPIFTTKSKKIIVWTSLTFILVALILSFRFIFFLFGYVPFSIIPFIGIFISLILVWTKDVSKTLMKLYSISQYIISLTLLLLAFELSKVNSNTWGSSTLFVGVFMTAFIVPLKHITRVLYERPFTYGLLDLITGLSSIAIIVIIGFGESEYNGRDNSLIRRGLLFLSISLIIEGILLIYKKYKNKKLPLTFCKLHCGDGA